MIYIQSLAPTYFQGITVTLVLDIIIDFIESRFGLVACVHDFILHIAFEIMKD
jgi:hypothetical protein